MAESRGLKGLESWAKKVTAGYNGVNVTDMTSSFRDGLAFCAIIHHYYPELIDFESLSKENILHNNSLAFSTAEKQLGIPALLDAEDMVKYARPDRLSIITYLSQLYNCFENQNRVNKVRPAVKRINLEKPSGSPAKVPLGEQKNTGRSHEICQNCKHRVFILERLMVEGKLYHRACFKCSKCDTILKPGAYVESDAPGTYECAVCPRDEKKSSRLNSADETNNQNQVSKLETSVESSREVTPEISPAVTQKPKVLSARFDSARNSFLQESVQSTTEAEDLNNHELTNGDSSASPHDSFSMSLDQALESLQSEQKAKDEEILSRTSRGDSFSSFGSQEEETTEKSNSKGSYQSVFTREALQITSLNTNFVPKMRHSSATTLDSLYNLGSKKTATSRQINFDIPMIRPSNTLTSTLPRPSSISNFQSARKSSISNSDSLEKVHSANNISDSNENLGNAGIRRKSFADIVSKEPAKGSESVSSRKGSLPENMSILKHQNELIADGENEVVMRQKARSKSNDSPDDDKILRRVDSASSTKRTSLSVKELIQLREASIHEANVSLNLKPIVPRKSTDESISEPDSAAGASLETKSSLEDQEEDIQHKDSKSISAPDTSEQISAMNKDNSSSDTTEIPTKELETKTVKIEKIEVEAEKEQSSQESQKMPPFSVAESSEKIYPDDLNPFGDDEDDEMPKHIEPGSYPDTLNPFGDDDADDNETNAPVSKKVDDYDDSKNPFAFDDDDEPEFQSPASKTKPSLPPARPPLPAIKTSSTMKSPQYHQSSPSLSNTSSPTGSMSGTHKKRKAPKPPHVKELFLNTHAEPPSSPVQTPSPRSLQTSPRSLQTSPSPKILKNKRAPPPPSPIMQNKIGQPGAMLQDSPGKGKLKKDEDNMKAKSVDSLQSPKSPTSSQDDDSQWKKKKRPAPPVPIPSRREIKKIPLHKIQAEMNEIEGKQIDLEKQGRELEVMIRDRDQDVEPTVEEEECIMQLFELVNQKNALFRRQAELMYIKRSQRLEEEQVELEYQIRCIMMKPASQKTDEDKAKEDELVQRLLDVVDQRNEIIDSIEMDRKRENEEDVMVQEQTEIKNTEIKEKSEKEKKKKEKKQKEKKIEKEKKDKKVEKEKKKEEKKKEKLKESKQQQQEGGILKMRTLLRK